MAEENKDEKTEAPTAKRLSKAREEGDVPLSNEVKNLAALISALALVALFGPYVAGRLGTLLGTFIEQMHTIPMDLEGLRNAMVGVMLDVALILALPVGLLVLFALAGVWSQIGFLWAPKKLQPKWNNINPITNVKKVISLQKLVELLKDVLKVTLVGGAVALTVIPNFSHPEFLLSKDPLVILDELYHLLLLVLLSVVLGYTIITVIDFTWTRYQHTKKLKMTKQEVKDEHKQQEGDPLIKGRIRSLRLKRVRERMMQNVPNASVVITNPTHFAVALQYDMDDMAAPKLVAKGVDHLARRIREVAEEHEVPVIENPPLARALYAAVELDQEIPPEHYKAVAEVIGFVMRMKGGGRGRSAGAGGAAR